MLNLKAVSRFFEDSEFSQSASEVVLYYDFLDEEEFNLDFPVVLLKNGSLTAFFKLVGVDFECMSREDLSVLANSARSFFDLFGKNVLLSNYFIRDFSTFRDFVLTEKAAEFSQFVQKENRNFFQSISEKTFSNSIICSLTINNPLLGNSTGFLSSPGQNFELLKDAIVKNISLLTEAYSIASSSFRGFGFFRVKRKEIESFLFKLLNFSGDLDLPGDREGHSLNFKICSSYYEFAVDSDYAKICSNEKTVYFKSIPLLSFNFTDILFFRDFFNIDHRFVLKQTFCKVGFDEVDRNLTFNRNISRSLIFRKSDAGAFIEEYDLFKDRALTNKEQALHYNMNVLVFSDNLKNLEKSTGKIIHLLKCKAIKAVPYRNFLRYSYFSFLPGHELIGRNILLKTNRLILSADAANLFSGYSLPEGSEKPLTYFIDRSGQLFGFNPFDSFSTASHLAICGPTRRGKSFFLVNKLLLPGLALHPFVFVVDNSDSVGPFFRILKQLLPGDTVIMDFSDKENLFRFNPFYIDKNKLGKDISEEQFNLCFDLLLLILGDLISQKDEPVLKKSLNEFFSDYKLALKKTPGTAVPPLDILRQNLQVNFPANEAIPDILDIWRSGLKGDILNSGVQRSLDFRYFYFNLQEFSTRPDVLAVVLFLIFSRLDRIIYAREFLNVKKIFLIDEAHFSLDIPVLSRYINKLIRTGAKFSLLVGLVFHSLVDALKLDEQGNIRDEAKGIVQNIMHLFMFSGQRVAANAFREFDMSESHIRVYRELDPGKYELFYWSADGIRRVLVPISDPFSYWVCTTQPDEVKIRNFIFENIFPDNFLETIKLCVKISGNETDIAVKIEKFPDYFSRNYPDLNFYPAV